MLATTFALIVFLTPLAWSPGPGNLFFAANGARFGLRRTLPANLGYHAATWCVTLVIGLGFVSARSIGDGWFTALQWLGALYVLWLARGLWRAGALDGGADARAAGFRDGAALLLLNPKAYVIVMLMFTQFQTESNLWMLLLITCVFTLNNLVAFTAWTWAGDALTQRFRDAAQARRLNRVLALLMAAVAVWIVLA